MRLKFGLALLLLAAAAPAPAADAPRPYQRAVAAGYKAAMLCSGIFDAGRTEAQVAGDELRGIYPEYEAIVPTLEATVDRSMGTVSVAFDDKLPPRRADWRPVTGCTLQPIGSTAPPIPPIHGVPARPGPADERPWPMGDAGIAPKPSRALAAAVDAAFDRATFGEKSETIGVIVVKDGRIAAERYHEGFGPFVPNRTWSVAKSIAGTMIGVAVKQGLLDPAKPANIPEWSKPGDPRAAITLDQLLRMASGLHSDAAGNRTDALYFGGSSVAETATQWPIEVMPGTRFRYSNNDILLAVHALKATLGDANPWAYRNFPHERLFFPIGMQNTRAGTDWQYEYVMSSQVWSTARDLARIGLLWLKDGVWQGERLLPEGWLKYMTSPSGPQPAEGPGYGATLWLFGPDQGLPQGSYAAQGNRGQYVMVIPSERLVIVRRGEDSAGARFDIAGFAARILAASR